MGQGEHALDLIAQESLIVDLDRKHRHLHRVCGEWHESRVDTPGRFVTVLNCWVHGYAEFSETNAINVKNHVPRLTKTA
jgi:hypothetical protein